MESVPSRPLCNLYHHPSIRIISLRRTVHHSTKPYYIQPFLTSNILYITVLPLNRHFNHNHMRLIVQWFRYTINIFVFLQLPPWRWPRDWPKHVGGHYIIKLHHKTKVHLLVFNKLHIRSAIFLAAIILPTKLKIQNVMPFVYCIILIFLLVTTEVQFNKLGLYSYNRLCYLGAGRRISSHAYCPSFSWEEVLNISELDKQFSPPV